MSVLPPFPIEIHRYIAATFAAVNRRVSEKIARVPNSSEPSLDMTFIECLTQYAAPRVVAPGWAVRIDVHFLGGLRHFYRWEIADIGLLIFAKQRNAVVANKVALLQSKRLFPLSGAVNEETAEDYRIGFGTLLPSIGSAASLSLSHKFEFTKQSKYKSLMVGDEQYNAIDAYEQQKQIPVHYLLYNPWTLPASYAFPLVKQPKLGARGEGGCRVIRSKALRDSMIGKPKNYVPSFQDILNTASKVRAQKYGWRLEHFVSHLVMKCKEGHIFKGLDEENMFALFNRRSGPIAAALAVTVEQYRD